MFALIRYLGFIGIFFFFNCLVGFLSMIVSKPAVLGVLYACVLYFRICTYSAQLSMFHMERRSSLYYYYYHYYPYVMHMDQKQQSRHSLTTQQMHNDNIETAKMTDLNNTETTPEIV